MRDVTRSMSIIAVQLHGESDVSVRVSIHEKVDGRKAVLAHELDIRVDPPALDTPNWLRDVVTGIAEYL